MEKALESLLDCKEIKPVNPKGDQPWILIGRTDAEAEAPILWPPDAKSQLRKDPDAGKDWGQEEKGTTEDDMIGWHHQLNGHESEQTSGDGEAWCAAVHGVAKSPTRLRDWTTKYIHKVEQWSSLFKSRTSPIIPEGNPIYIVIFKIYIWSSSTVSGSQLPKPLNFWRRVIRMSFGYVNEVTFRSTQGSGLMPEGPTK